MVVRPLSSQVAEASLAPGYPVSWTSAIAVECYARSGTATAPDVAVDALLEAVYARLMADPTLGGSWGPYYDDWPFAVVADDDPLYAVVPGLAGAAGQKAEEQSSRPG